MWSDFQNIYGHPPQRLLEIDGLVYEKPLPLYTILFTI